MQKIVKPPANALEALDLIGTLTDQQLRTVALVYWSERADEFLSAVKAACEPLDDES